MLNRAGATVCGLTDRQKERHLKNGLEKTSNGFHRPMERHLNPSPSPYRRQDAAHNLIDKDMADARAFLKT
jgi:hypothetical protein